MKQCCLQKKKETAEKIPCQYTVEELKQRVTRAVTELRRGCSGLTAEEFRKQADSWK